MKIIIKKITILVFALALVPLTGFAVASNAKDEDLSYGFYSHQAHIREQGTTSANILATAPANDGRQWRADCVALDGTAVTNPDTGIATTVWWHARDLKQDVLGYSTAAYLTYTTLGNPLWGTHGTTCKRG